MYLYESSVGVSAVTITGLKQSSMIIVLNTCTICSYNMRLKNLRDCHTLLNFRTDEHSYTELDQLVSKVGDSKGVIPPRAKGPRLVLISY